MSDSELIMPGIGRPAPEFDLPVIGRAERARLADLRGGLVVVDFWSAECPWSQKYDPYFQVRAATWAAQGIRLALICSNADESDARVLEALAERELDFTILRDEGNLVADAYGASTTPHVYVVDTGGNVAYRGAVDDRTFRQEPGVFYLDDALAALLAGQQPPVDDTPARGCTIVRTFD